MACDITVVEKVETLVERLSSSTLLEDRREACRSLCLLSKENRVVVCAQAMEPLLQTLKDNVQDPEIAYDCLKSLNYIISGDLADLTAGAAFDNFKPQSDPGLELSEIFLKKQENVEIILETLVEMDCNIRRTSLRVLCGLIRHKLTAVQESILSFPLGVVRLVDLLSENDDQTRYEAITLFVHLSKDNPNMQKVIVFHSAFDKLINIIQAEAFLNGGCIVEECLLIFLNLLQFNESNQFEFQVKCYIQKFMPFFEGLHQTEWDQPKISNMMLVLQILDTLLMTSNSPDLVQSSQTIMQRCGLIQKLCHILEANSLPLCLLSETINMAADIVRGQTNLNFLTMPTSPMQQVLFLSMIKDHGRQIADYERRFADYERRFADYERQMRELYNYVHNLHSFLSQER